MYGAAEIWRCLCKDVLYEKALSGLLARMGRTRSYGHLRPYYSRITNTPIQSHAGLYVFLSLYGVYALVVLLSDNVRRRACFLCAQKSAYAQA